MLGCCVLSRVASLLTKLCIFLLFDVTTAMWGWQSSIYLKIKRNCFPILFYFEKKMVTRRLLIAIDPASHAQNIFIKLQPHEKHLLAAVLAQLFTRGCVLLLVKLLFLCLKGSLKHVHASVKIGFYFTGRVKK